MYLKNVKKRRNSTIPNSMMVVLVFQFGKKAFNNNSINSVKISKLNLYINFVIRLFPDLREKTLKFHGKKNIPGNDKNPKKYSDRKSRMSISNMLFSLIIIINN